MVIQRLRKKRSNHVTSSVLINPMVISIMFATCSDGCLFASLMQPRKK